MLYETYAPIAGKYAITYDDNPAMATRLNLLRDLAAEQVQVLARVPVDREAARALITRYEAANMRYSCGELRKAINEPPPPKAKQPGHYGLRKTFTADMVLDCVRSAGRITCVEIARELGCASCTVNHLVKKLRESGKIGMVKKTHNKSWEYTAKER